MDKSVKQKVVTFLKQIGLDQEQAFVYIYLQENGPSTVLAISRGLKTGRTKLYPALDEMVEKQVIAVHERHYGTTYEALPPENLEFLVAEYERRASGLRHNLKAAVNALNSSRDISPATSKILEYKGVEGLKQVNFNMMNNADGEYFVFEKENLSKHKGMTKHFAERMHELQVKRGLIGHDLTNNPKWSISLDVPGMKKLSKAAYVDPKVFEIQFEMYVYNNVVTLLSYDPDDILCVEIHNPALAAQQKQLFKLAWSQAKEIKI